MPTKSTKAKTTKKTVESIPEIVSVKTETKKTERKSILIPLMIGAIVVASFAVGYLYGKVSVYEKIGQTTKGTGTTAAGVQQAETQPATVTVDMIKKLFADNSNVIFGNPSSKLLFAEFSDPSCPYCHIAAGKNPELNKEVGDRFTLKENGGTYVAPVPEMKKLVEQGKAAYVWVYSPGHGNGELATQALYCAKEQNKFWEAHDLLMSNKGYTLLNETVQNDVKKASVMADFLKSAVDSKALLTCLTSGKYAGRVQSDETLSRQYGVEGTPSFFVNEKNFAGAYSFTEMQSAVDAAMK
jgi:protein-disulfide isomerase